MHTITLEYDEADYRAMLETFVQTGEKEWIHATVAIDGQVLEDVGIKLKGNSSLQGLAATVETATSGVTGATGTTEMPIGPGGENGGPAGDVSADEPEDLPWRIRLDKFVAGQNYEGQTDVVVRGGSTETSLNEAVALELIGAAGLLTEEAAPIRFSVNGSAETLRLLIENPTETWYDEKIGTDGVLYKAESGGDYSYRGKDSESYVEAFDVEASTSGEDDYAPLIGFLDFVNNADDATFAAELAERLDVDAFATYLAIQDLVANADDIDGPGNNSYLHYDAATGAFTVIAWDQNLSFGGLGAMGVGGGGRVPGAGATLPDGATIPDGASLPGGMTPPDGWTPPDIAALPDGATLPDGAPTTGGERTGVSRGNVLAERFLADDGFAALVDAAKDRLATDLYDSGEAQDILDAWAGVLSEQASDLVPAETVESEAAAIAEFFATTD